jgi:uncharacterized damage-inducible protein DinB
MTSPSEVLREAFAYHAWATTTLIDALERLDAGALDSGIEGTYGSIAETLTHLVDADDRYLQRLVAVDVPPYVDHGAQPLGALRARVVEHGPRWTAMLERLDAGTLAARVDRGEDGTIDPAETLLLLQALHHGNDHRTQVCSALGALGLDVPDLDVWTFFGA